MHIGRGILFTYTSLESEVQSLLNILERKSQNAFIMKDENVYIQADNVHDPMDLLLCSYIAMSESVCIANVI